MAVLDYGSLAMNHIRTIRLQQLHGQVEQVVHFMTRVQYWHLSASEPWRPAINAYRCHDRIAVCVDLAGVDRNRIELQVEPRLLTVRGQRPAPEPAQCGLETMQILAMEIDHGPFERQVRFMQDVLPEQVTAEQRDGWLWIYLPLRPMA